MINKIWYKSKTIWWNVFVALVTVASMSEVLAVFSPSAAPWVAVFGALGNLYLRSITDKGITVA